jgi:hypothetical protein
MPDEDMGLVSKVGKGGAWDGMIAKVDCGDYARSRAEGLANAKLIADAPTLYSENVKLRARIAELEAALKPFADCGVWDGYKDEEVFKLGFKIADLRAARAAYLGEKE